ncbi:hypothetical protein Esi_0630_0001 [Ectocarpus siliculosus]|uniref:Uncharacterized protein n=1 Tax=Ectocarpus siliculosus TaxID=2880 RepID=D7G5D1_ECTSI|nr:hypothetical protein Esi_0630_0001 [Ectocarpus siliculosus]|eukprot:CBJ33825.1 hypothetical protein Esi_0630_0001 [Ectocarpus siliculosus]
MDWPGEDVFDPRQLACRSWAVDVPGPESDPASVPDSVTASDTASGPDSGPDSRPTGMLSTLVEPSRLTTSQTNPHAYPCPDSE